MDFSAWLKAYRKEAGMTQAELAAWLNRQGVVGKRLDSGIISNWEQGRSLPDYRACLALAYCAGVSDPYSTFLGVTRGYRLNEEGRRKLDDYGRLLEESPKYTIARPTGERRTLRFYSAPVSAGLGQFLDSDDYEEREVGDWAPAEADFAIRVAGNSMEPLIVNHQWIFVREQKSLNDGEIGVFIYDGESYCKELGRDDTGRPVLLSLNPEYEPLEIRIEDAFWVVGKVVE